MPEAPRSAAVVMLLAAAVVAGCSAAPPESPTPPPPPPPPAACLLDPAALAAATGLGWAADATTAGDTRCVYDPANTPRADDGPAFVAVDLTPLPEGNAEPAAVLDSAAAACDARSRAPLAAPDHPGFVCRFPDGAVFAATVRSTRLITVTASAVPAGTTAAQLVIAFDQQLSGLR